MIDEKIISFHDINPENNHLGVEADTNKEISRFTISLSDEEHRKINIFFSNFSEAYFADYDYKNFDLKRLINFAYIHNKINNYSNIEVDGNDMYISAEHVEKTINKYFGIIIDHRSAGGFVYRDGNYYTPGADGENYNYFSQVNTFIDNEDGTYSAEISIYMLEDVDDGVDSIYYEPKKVWENTHPYQYVQDAEALIKPAVADGKSTYQLLKYKTFD
jgi:hypothetical protein